jgi:hypothetical protein
MRAGLASSRHEFERGWAVCLVAVVLLGVAFRLTQWGAGLNFWGDEILLLTNVLGHPVGTLLFGPLDSVSGNLQVAPPLFLLGVKASTGWFGTGELVTRLLPQLSAIAGLLGFAFLARRHLSAPAAVLLTAAFAGSNELVYQSANLKQYSGDVLASVVILLALGRSPASWRWWQLTLAGVVAVWWSHTALFVWVGAAAGIALSRSEPATPGEAQPAHWPGWRTLAIGGGLVLASFAAMYLLSARKQSGGVLTDFWLNLGAFPDYRSPGSVVLFVLKTPLILYERLRKPFSVVLLLPGLVGLWSLVRGRNWLWLLACTLPPFINFVLAMCWRYPMEGSRICIYLFPGLLLLAGFGLDAVPIKRCGPVTRLVMSMAIWGAVTTVSVAAVGTSIARMFGKPICRGQLGSAARFVVSQSPEGQGIGQPLILVASPTQRLEAQFYAPSLPLVVWAEGKPPSVPVWFIRSFTPGKSESGEGGRAMADLRKTFAAERRFKTYGGEVWYLTPLAR